MRTKILFMILGAATFLALFVTALTISGNRFQEELAQCLEMECPEGFHPDFHTICECDPGPKPRKRQ